ncbi:MAG: hypothetical protein PHQ04_09600 [Opitutaceae bacterium]|nr:hypothetical protein [Opitutaceae bacterium]
MKIPHVTLVLVTLALGLVSSALSGAEQPGWINAADNKIHAQKLVNEQMAKFKNIDIKFLGLHAVAPGEKEQKMIACTHDRINKPDSEDDYWVSQKHWTLVFQKLAEPEVIEVMIPLQDASGNVIGTACFIFKGFKTGDSEYPYYMRAVAMRNEMARATPSLAALFQPIQ